jgi:glycogen operon protein
MFVMGDEVRRSQGGNNNAYCQDSETSWFDWELLSNTPIFSDS